MSDSIDDLLARRWQQFSSDIRSLLVSPAREFGSAMPPRSPGVYILQDEFQTYTYVGIATDLQDRFRKHLSGDESHAIQRAYAVRFPDRSDRRDFIRANIWAKWLVIEDPIRLGDMERILIWLLQPVWNRR
jgi:excinuclease UvrABC nuclease subunit